MRGSSPAGGRKVFPVAPTCRYSNHRHSQLKERNKSLAMRYSELLRLREKVLEAEYKRHLR